MHLLLKQAKRAMFIVVDGFELQREAQTVNPPTWRAQVQSGSHSARS